MQPAMRVKQQLHYWSEEGNRRTLTLAIKYMVPEDFHLRTGDYTQHVYLIEYRNMDVKDWKSKLKLTCISDTHGTTLGF
jgi:hypothetical protein